MKIPPAIIKAAFLVIAAIILFMLPGLKLPYLDRQADGYFAGAVTKAGISYGICRAVNASVSVIKESQVHVAPAGNGVSLAVGQILDPLDDITERTSDILVTAIISLGIQKIIYELGVEFAPAMAGAILIALAAVSFWRGGRAEALRRLILRAVILIAVARLCLPASSIISSFLADHYFSPKITEAQNGLKLNSPEMERLKDMHIPEAYTPWEMIRNSAGFINTKLSDLRAVLATINKETITSMVSALLELSYLYVALFMIQIILLPLGIFWLLARVGNTFFGINLPESPRHRKESGRGQ